MYRQWRQSGICHDLMRQFRCNSSGEAKRSRADVFDRDMKRRQREVISQLDDFQTHQYIKEEIGARIADRVWDVKRVFSTGVELSAGTGFIAKHLNNNVIENLILCDTSMSCLERIEKPETVYTHKVLVDEEHLPFRNNSVDIFLSSLSIHWINKLPQFFSEIMRCLTHDGVFLGSLFSGQTLYELRCSLQLAETERLGGFSPHVSPFVEPVDVGTLLSRSGFNLLTVDNDEILVKYPSMFKLIDDLKLMGESNAAWNRRLHLHRESLLAAAAIYQEFYADDDGHVLATFQITNFIGWKPHESQAKPAARGSATVSFKDIGNVDKMKGQLESMEKKDKNS